jgi:hypothetical protein
MPRLLLRREALLAGLSTWAFAAIPRCARDRGRRSREGLRRADGRGQERRALGPQEGLHRFAEIGNKMKAINHLDSLGRPLADALRVQGTAIPTDDDDRRMCRQPGRHGGRCAVG